MRTSNQESNEAERVRLQVVLCEPVAAEVAKQAAELDHSQSWVCGFGINTALEDKNGFLKWIAKRLKEPRNHRKWADVSSEAKEQRLQLRIDKSKAEELASVAVALNQTPARLAGLFIEFGVEEYALTLKLMKTRPVKAFRKMIYGENEKSKFDVADEE